MNVFDKLFSHTQTGLTGLDIGTGSVKLVTLQKDNQGWLAACAAYAIVEPAQDAALCEENTLKAIRECFKKAGPAAARNVVCGISGQAVSVRGFSFPPLPDEAIDQAVKLEAQQTCALDVSNSVIDYQLLSDETQPPGQTQKQGRKGFFVAGLQDAVNQKVKLAQQTQLKPFLMDMDSLAILNCISQLPENQTTESIAALDIGHSATTMTILGSDGVPFVRTLSGSAQQILTMVSLKTQKSVAEIKKRLMDDAISEDGDLEVEFKTASTKLITDAIETLRFYSLQQNTDKVSRLYLCGGFSLYKPFVRLIQNHLPVTCTVFDPLTVLRCPDHGEIRHAFSQFGPAMTVAAGLAMRSINHVHN
jgi:type IV pilus assembly protein PilM